MRYWVAITFWWLSLSCNAQFFTAPVHSDSLITFEQKQAKASNNTVSPKGNGEQYFPGSFKYAAQRILPAVVSITSTYVCEKPEEDTMHMADSIALEDIWLYLLSAENTLVLSSTASGVLISEDGYIVTTYHLAQHTCRIEVTLSDKRSYIAEIIGTDSLTDIALLKINESNLPFAEFGNSDQINVGDWVLAVGNPYNLNSTVTAGIVSAKGRALEPANSAIIESYIQTDAVVNPGNSGGALVDVNGNLVGINAAIASPTDTYTGYSFAIPINIALKVINDILNYGKAMRGYLGVNIRSINAKDAQNLHITKPLGVLVEYVKQNSGSMKAGIQAGDVITKIDGQTISSSTDINGILAVCRPGDMLIVSLLRGGKELNVMVKLAEQ